MAISACGMLTTGCRIERRPVVCIQRADVSIRRPVGCFQRAVVPIRRLGDAYDGPSYPYNGASYRDNGRCNDPTGGRMLTKLRRILPTAFVWIRRVVGCLQRFVVWNDEPPDAYNGLSYPCNGRCIDTTGRRMLTTEYRTDPTAVVWIRRAVGCFQRAVVSIQRAVVSMQPAVGCLRRTVVSLRRAVVPIQRDVVRIRRSVIRIPRDTSDCRHGVVPVKLWRSKKFWFVPAGDV